MICCPARCEILVLQPEIEPKSPALEGGFFKKIHRKLCIYLWLCWVFVAARRLFLAVASGGYSLLRCTFLIAMASLVEQGL